MPKNLSLVKDFEKAQLKKEPLDYFHWHFEIRPKVTTTAGFEWGSGFYINPMPPEDAAVYMKEAFSKE